MFVRWAGPWAGQVRVAGPGGGCFAGPAVLGPWLGIRVRFPLRLALVVRKEKGHVHVPVRVRLLYGIRLVVARVVVGTRSSTGVLLLVPQDPVLHDQCW